MSPFKKKLILGCSKPVPTSVESEIRNNVLRVYWHRSVIWQVPILSLTNEQENRDSWASVNMNCMCHCFTALPHAIGFTVCISCHMCIGDDLTAVCFSYEVFRTGTVM
jgi:hypothetical protein